MKPAERRPLANAALLGATGYALASVLTTMIVIVGPGLLVMLADTDAGNIVTAAQARASWGYRLLPLPLLLVPALVMVQELAVRIGVFRRCGFGDLIWEHMHRPWTWVAAVALVIAMLSSLVTELTGITGVGELFGASRWLVLPLAALALILLVFTGEYRRVERVALIFGLFAVSFIVVAWQSHDAGLERPVRRLRNRAVRQRHGRGGRSRGGTHRRWQACQHCGGGDTIAALNAAGVTTRLTYVSTAGGAFLEWLEGKALPSVEALKATPTRAATGG